MGTSPSSFVIDSICFVLEAYGFPDQFMAQVSSLTIIEKDHRTVGCDYSFNLNTDYKLIIDPNDNSILSDGCTVYVDSIGLEADLTVWFRNGKIDYLEVSSHTCAFPENDPENYYFKLNPVNYIDHR
jgi:hypothetical protein